MLLFEINHKKNTVRIKKKVVVRKLILFICGKSILIISNNEYLAPSICLNSNPNNIRLIKTVIEPSIINALIIKSIKAKKLN